MTSKTPIIGSLHRAAKRFSNLLAVQNIRTFVDPQASKRVGLVMDVADMGRLAEFMKSKAAAEAMEHDGVLPETLVILVQS